MGLDFPPSLFQTLYSLCCCSPILHLKKLRFTELNIFPKVTQLEPGPHSSCLSFFDPPLPSFSSWEGMSILTSRFFPFSDLPDSPPALVPAPPKRARPSLGCPLPEHEDPEERLNRHDQHITAVLTKIIVRLTLVEWDEASWGSKNIGGRVVRDRSRGCFRKVGLYSPAVSLGLL